MATIVYSVATDNSHVMEIRVETDKTVDHSLAPQFKNEINSVICAGLLDSKSFRHYRLNIRSNNHQTISEVLNLIANAFGLKLSNTKIIKRTGRYDDLIRAYSSRVEVTTDTSFAQKVLQSA